MNRLVILSAAAIALALGTSTAIAQQQLVYQAPQTVASQIVWTPTYFYDAAGALWLVYVPTSRAAPAQYAPPTQYTAPTSAPANQAAIRAPRSMVSSHNTDFGSGRNIQMHKPWMSGRR